MLVKLYPKVWYFYPKVNDLPKTTFQAPLKNCYQFYNKQRNDEYTIER